jgi:hypothetical protein
MQRTVLLAAIAFFLAAVLGACGAAGPLDDDLILITPDSGVIDSAAPDATPVPDAGPPVDAAPPPVDAGTGLIQCGTCVASQCGTDVTTCLTDPSCTSIIQCVATTCFAGLGGGGGGGGGGGIDPTCFLTCAGSGGSGAGEALGIFQCITGDCGSACGGLLGGLGGLGGGGIPDPAPPSVHQTPAERRAIFADAFSAWPQLTSREPTSETTNARN